MPDRLEQVFAIYRDAFPASERRDEGDLRKALATPAYRLLTTTKRDRVFAFAIVFIPPASDFALLEYLAVYPTLRGKGYGAALLLCAIRRSLGRPVLVELESASNGPVANRRQQLYLRCGFKPIEALRYQLPLPGDPPPMELWVHRPSVAPIERPQLVNWLTTIYTEVYHRPSTDPRINQMLATVQDPV